MIHDRHGNLKYNHGNRTFQAKGYYVSTVELNKKTIAKYIREQEAEDRLWDNMSKRECVTCLKNIEEDKRLTVNLEVLQGLCW